MLERATYKRTTDGAALAVTFMSGPPFPDEETRGAALRGAIAGEELTHRQSIVRASGGRLIGGRVTKAVLG
jgi:hypothetical protein